MKCRVLVLTVGLWMADQGGVGTLAAAQQETSAPTTVRSPKEASQTLQSREQQLRTLDAARISLHEAAKVNGGTFSVTMSLTDLERGWRGNARDLNDLVKSSPEIVIGIIRAARPRLTPDERSIETLYEVAVIERLKGVGPPTVYVRVSGGRWTFADGTVGELITSDFSLAEGAKFVFCLRPAPIGVGTEPSDATRNDVYLLSYGPQGVFDVSASAARSLASSRMAIRAQYDGLSVQTLTEAIRQTVREQQAVAR